MMDGAQDWKGIKAFDSYFNLDARGTAQNKERT